MSFYVSTATFFLLHFDEWDRVVALPRHKFVTGATLLQLDFRHWRKFKNKTVRQTCDDFNFPIVNLSSDLYIIVCPRPVVLICLVIVLSVLLRITDSDYPFSIC